MSKDLVTIQRARAKLPGYYTQSSTCMVGFRLSDYFAYGTDYIILFMKYKPCYDAALVHKTVFVKCDEIITTLPHIRLTCRQDVDCFT